jgi:hypothetical protein
MDWSSFRQALWYANLLVDRTFTVCYVNLGKNNGTVKGVKYFKCKEKHGVFVKREKIIHHPGSSPGSLTSNKSSTAVGKPPSPLASKRKVTSNPQLGRSTYANSSRRTSLGPPKR